MPEPQQNQNTKIQESREALDRNDIAAIVDRNKLVSHWYQMISSAQQLEVFGCIFLDDKDKEVGIHFDSAQSIVRIASYNTTEEANITVLKMSYQEFAEMLNTALSV